MEILLDQLGLEKVEVLRNNIVVAKRSSTQPDDLKRYCLKLVDEQEFKLFRDVFSKIDQTKFTTLRVPTPLKVGSLLSNHWFWILTDLYEGENFRWDESNPEIVGGIKLKLEWASSVVEMLADLQKIDSAMIGEIVPTFNFQEWKNKFSQAVPVLISAGILSAMQINMAHKILENLVLEHPTFSNGDFQFRNFIKTQEGKIMVVDWTENYGWATTPMIEPVECIIMYIYTLMWSNPLWQTELLKQAKRKFNLSDMQFRQALLIKSFNQAMFWDHNSALAKRQFEHFNQALSDEFRII